MITSRLPLRSTLFCASACLACGSQASLADTLQNVPLSGQLMPTLSWASSAAGQTPATVTGSGVNNGTGPVLVENLANNAASTYTLQDSFAAPAGSYAAAAQINGESYGFVDSYVLDVPASMASAYVFSLDLGSLLGLEDLTTRLYEYPDSGQNLTIGGTGNVAGLVDNWSAVSADNGSVSSTQLETSTLAAGEYVLQVAGILSGASSGSYTGELAILPVPLPPALPMLLAGLAAFAVASRARRHGG